MSDQNPSSTPIRLALEPDSDLQGSVQEGLGAVERAHRRCLAVEVRPAFGDSLDLDAAMEAAHPDENRWDYLLGHTSSGQVVALEPHSARTDEISSVIRKRKAAIEQLREHLRPGQRISSWLWVASGKNHFADTEKARRRLDENGITFVARQVLAHHLPD